MFQNIQMTYPAIIRVKKSLPPVVVAGIILNNTGRFCKKLYTVASIILYYLISLVSLKKDVH